MKQKSETAAHLVAEDRLTDEDIAAACGISRPTLWRLKNKPEFQQRVQGIVEAYSEAVLKRGIARRDRRVAALDERWEGMRRIIADRSTDSIYENEAGGTTGLLAKIERQIGTGDRAIFETSFVVDMGLLKELRAHEKQAAEELGQWTEKHELTGSLKVTLAIGGISGDSDTGD